MKPVIIIPTLNERHNIGNVLENINKQNIDTDIVVVDGKSTDGTPEIVSELAGRYNNIVLLHQEKTGDFGGALQLGFKHALKHAYDPILTMDGDGSHRPKYLQNFLHRSDKYDLVIGSRYIDGVRVEGWRFRKLLVSKLANMYVSYLLVKPIWDFTSGFRCYRRRFLERIDIDSLHSEAYIIQIELLHLAYKNRMRVKEIPFIYQDTHFGVSKVSPRTRRKTALYILKFRAPILEIMRHLAYLKKEYERFVEEYEDLLNPPELKGDGRFENPECPSVSVGVMAYNEEAIIEKCIRSLQTQSLQSACLKEIIVVSSGSTDKTDRIVEALTKQDERIRLVTQPQRLGKASAINEFLKQATGDIAIIESADTIPERDTVEYLVQPFSDEKVGMVGSHPIPVNDSKTFVGYCVHKLWELHHNMAMQKAKCGEMVAFRNIVTRIPKFTAVDEAAIEAILSENNFTLAYAPKARVRNKGPETLKDFIKQRRRIASGHRHLKASVGHQVATYKPAKILKFVLRQQRWTPKAVIYTGLLIFIEAYARMAGAIDFYLRDKNPFIWDISATTKKM